MSKVLGVLGLSLAAIFLGEVAVAAPEEGPCAAAYKQWAQTHELLKEAVHALREAGAESVEPRINQTLTDGTRLSLAQKIQSVLKDRRRKITEAARKGTDAAEQERESFEQLRRCSASDSQRRAATQATLNAVTRERSKLLADLQDLLLDEAYVQYKRESPNPAPTYSGYGPDQQSAQYQYRQPGPGRRMGYDAYNPGYGYQ
jgi:hypothetical protein